MLHYLRYITYVTLHYLRYVTLFMLRYVLTFLRYLRYLCYVTYVTFVTCVTLLTLRYFRYLRSWFLTLRSKIRWLQRTDLIFYCNHALISIEMCRLQMRDRIRNQTIAYLQNGDQSVWFYRLCGTMSDKSTEFETIACAFTCVLLPWACSRSISSSCQQ